MEPTIQQKNVAIAEMLGFQIKGGLVWKNPPQGWKFQCPLHDPLPFDSDANWQLEALNWLEKQKYTWSWESDVYGSNGVVLGYLFVIYDSKGYELLALNRADKREVVFEALYQFSQYLKKNSNER